MLPLAIILNDSWLRWKSILAVAYFAALLVAVLLGRA